MAKCLWLNTPEFTDPNMYIFSLKQKTKQNKQTTKTAPLSIHNLAFIGSFPIPSVFDMYIAAHSFAFFLHLLEKEQVEQMALKC